ncbi:hypothetical protein [Rhodococcus sp. BE178]|uniref:hypothetical protein n=1 Tax=Rhodococcus sp. BE178 TaxID=2817737 RepID=UPI003D1B35F8
MAIRIADADTGHTRERGELTFADVPERLRPSGFRYWLNRVPEYPAITNVDHCVAAFGEDIAGSRLLVARHAPHRPPADPQWRTQIATAAQWEAYVAWCAEQGLTIDGADPGSRGAVPREWSWTEFRRWEDAQ